MLNSFTVGEHTFTSLATRLMQMLRDAMAHSTGPAQGTDTSPYVFGGDS